MVRDMGHGHSLMELEQSVDCAGGPSGAALVVGFPLELPPAPPALATSSAYAPGGAEAVREAASASEGPTATVQPLAISVARPVGPAAACAGQGIWVVAGSA